MRNNTKIIMTLLCCVPPGLLAQTVPTPQAADLDRVVVTGIRSSLESSLNLKRDSSGVVDGIIAEDMGKFPDTNLAESLQRISGVSIDRTQSGEGQRVTVRGMGPDFNMVLLNGRQMPAANIPGNGAGISNSRAFDFANLATETVSELQVYKTTRADKPTGGMGATIDIRTAHPLDNPGFKANFGIKGVMDRAVKNIPPSYPGSSVTPEISGIFSQTFADNRFGIAASGSYQERDSGYSQARVNRWVFLRGADASGVNCQDCLPLPDQPEYSNYNITNRPGPNDIYARPASIGYLVSGEQRQRRNAQVIMQFAPNEAITGTLDYTYADNRMQRRGNEMFVQFRRSAGDSTWSDGPISAPLIYSEYLPTGRGVNSINNSRLAVRNELKSLGFNVTWKANDNLEFALDYHDSTAEARPDNPLGSANFLATSALVRGDTTVDFSGPFPILNMQLGPGVTQLDPEHGVLGLSGFRRAFSRSEVEQFQVNGTFRFADYQAFDFGAAGTEVFNRIASSERSNFELNGVGTPDNYPDDIWHADHYGRYFDRFPGHSDPNFSGRFLIADFDRLREHGIALRSEQLYSPLDTFTQDLRTIEKSRSAYLQWRNSFDWVIPVNVALGVRYETTEVRSPSQVLPPEGNILWISDDNFTMRMAADPILSDGETTGKYHFWLPNLDIRADLRENIVLRSSYGKSIGRPGWRDLQGGVSVSERYGIISGSGSRGNPALLPRQSKNFDLSLEWYYTEGSYASVGYFHKSIKNFIGNITALESPYPIYSPVGGGYWREAVENACMENEFECIRAYIFANHAGDLGITLPSDGNAGTISGIPGDPLARFMITSPVNQRSDTLDGFELSVQHMFGQSGFGISANYTKVDSGLRYDNYSLEAQYPMAGLSDSANLVIFYDKHHWQIRAAWNWRDEFLSTDGGSTGSVAAEPYYTESYRQLDINVTYMLNEHLSLFIEGINLTDETQRRWIRHPNLLADASQTGTRYMFGARYKF